MPQTPFSPRQWRLWNVGRQDLAHSVTHLPIVQQDNPHQDNVDVGPQGLVMIDFVHLKDKQGYISQNHRFKTLALHMEL